MSEFSYVHQIRIGNEGEVFRRLGVDARGGARVVRVFLRAVNLFDLNDEQPGYWEAVDRCLELCNAAGFYVNFVIFCDAQNMTKEQKRAFLDKVLARYNTHPGIIWALANEWYQNGFSSYTELFEFADVMASVLGHRDFIISDARDGDDPDASEETKEETDEIANHCNIVVLHSSRKGGATPEPSRLRRWVDHLEGFYDVLQHVGGGVFGYHEEPMGHASQQWVPLPNGKTYEREYNLDCAIAGAFTSLCAELAYCYHRVSEQDDGTPGLDIIGDVLNKINFTFDPAFRYLNDSWPGSPSRGFTWRGGKVRHLVNGVEGITLAYGSEKGTVSWANGYAPIDTLYDGAQCTLWKVRKG